MPTPRRNETRSEFVNRCVPIVLEDGTAQDQKQAVAVCFSMWREAKKGKEMSEDIANTEQVEQEEKAHLAGMDSNFVPMAITTFSDLDAANEAREMADDMKRTTVQFAEMAENIFLSDEIEDKAVALQVLADEFSQRVQEVAQKERRQPLTDYVKNLIADYSKQAPMKTEGGVKFPAGDFAFVPDRDKPSTWKLRLAEGRPGNITVRQLGRAAAALSPGGFRSRRVQLPSNAVAGVKRRIRSEYGKLNVKREDMPDSVKALEFMVWKEGDVYRWLATYSNMYRDRDNPPEILSSDAHKEFVQAVDLGEWGYPELWLWHVEGTKSGIADWVAYDDNTGFALASGILTDKNVAESLMSMDDLAVSHGMPIEHIERDSDDPTIIVKYRTSEISPLPEDAAANELTDFTFKEEKAMAIPDEKKDFLRQVGFSDERIAEIETNLSDKAREAEEQGLEFKEVAGTEESAETAAEPVAAAESSTEEAGTQSEPDALTRQEVADAILAASQPLQSAVENLAVLVSDLSAEVKALKTPDDERIAEMAELTPAASLLDLMKLRAIGSPEAKIDGRSSLAKSKPKEAESTLPVTPVSFINRIMQSGLPS